VGVHRPAEPVRAMKMDFSPGAIARDVRQYRRARRSRNPLRTGCRQTSTIVRSSSAVRRSR
jgi:hypothetical protein